MQPRQQGFNLIELMIVVAVIGILAALAFPLYRDYVIRAKVSEALLVAGKLKTDLSLFYADKGRFPVGSERITYQISSKPEKGDNPQTPTIRGLSLSNITGQVCNTTGCSGIRIEIQLQRSVYFGIDDKHSQLRLEGRASPGGSINWFCGPRDVQPLKLEWLPATCRHPPT